MPSEKKTGRFSPVAGRCFAHEKHDARILHWIATHSLIDGCSILKRGTLMSPKFQASAVRRVRSDAARSVDGWIFSSLFTSYSQRFLVVPAVRLEVIFAVPNRQALSPNSPLIIHFFGAEYH
jgi:hypothetical protein